MRTSTKRNLSLAALIAALVAAGSLFPLAYKNRNAQPQDTTVAAVPATPAPAPEAAVPAPPPGTEVVPPEESETDRGSNATAPSGPTLSFGRAAGLHHTPDPLKLNSSAALLVNQDTGEVLARKNDQVVLPMASLTKLMTALVVVEANQPMDEMLTITGDDVDNERHSRSRLKVGSTLTRREALHLALMSSENRAAHALGRAYPGGLEKMVEAMNTRARALGMKNTTYVDPTGLSNRNQSTARDIAVLVGAMGKNEMLAEFSTTPSHVASLGSRTLQYINSNRLVRNQKAGWDIELQKTGYIVEAGRCLTMLTKVGDHKMIMVLLDAETNGARVQDAERMRRYVVAQYNLPEPAVMQARSEPAPKVASAAKKARDKAEGRKTVVAKKEGRSKAKGPQVASKKPAGKTTVAAAKRPAKADDDKKGRVRQTFAAGKSEQKS